MHPDRNLGNPDATNQFQRLGAAIAAVEKHETQQANRAQAGNRNRFAGFGAASPQSDSDDEYGYFDDDDDDGLSHVTAAYMR